MNQSVAGRLKGISRAVITAVVAFVVIIIVCASTAFAQLISAYTVEIAVDNSKFSITTNETEPIEILSQANVSFSQRDKLDTSEFCSGEGGVIRVNRLKTVNIEFDKTIAAFEIYSNTVGAALDEIGITPGTVNTVNYQTSDSVVDGMVITLDLLQSTFIKTDGKKINCPVIEGNVEELLRISSITLDENDYTEPSLDTQVRADITINVFRVEYKNEIKREKLPYETVKQEDKNSYKGIKTIISEGKNGTVDVTYEVKYVNGKATSKKAVAKKIVKEAKSEVVKVGTKKTNGNISVTSNGVKSKNGYRIGQVIKGRYTHYCACGVCGSGTGRTASGLKVANGMSNPYYIACNWLPMGSVVNIDGVNYMVVDRGGSGLSRVGRVDIFTPEGHKACFRYGTGGCTITIVRIGW